VRTSIANLTERQGGVFQTHQKAFHALPNVHRLRHRLSKVHRLRGTLGSTTELAILPQPREPSLQPCTVCECCRERPGLRKAVSSGPSGLQRAPAGSSGPTTFRNRASGHFNWGRALVTRQKNSARHSHSFTTRTARNIKQCGHLLIKHVAVAAYAPMLSCMLDTAIQHAPKCLVGQTNAQSACNGHPASKGHSCKQSRSKLEAPCISESFHSHNALR
jgi:hypothetical protein